jgi:hypothetical protein
MIDVWKSFSNGKIKMDKVFFWCRGASTANLLDQNFEPLTDNLINVGMNKFTIETQ